MREQSNKQKGRMFGRAAGLALCLLAAVCLLWPVTLSAAATHSVNIIVELEQNGDAWVTEVWDVTVDDGTEFYLSKYYLDEQQISDLRVSDESGMVYENIGEWDSGRSRKQKTGQCGLIEINDGYELCWGIGSDYGRRVYTVSYKMTNVVKGYDGADAINQWFVSQELLAEPQSVSLVIRRTGMEMTQENTRVWAFGTEGEIYVQGGEVRLGTSGRLKSDEYLAVLIAFEEGMFQPEDVRDKDFDEVLDQAREGSGYTQGEKKGISLGGVMGIVFGGGLGAFIFTFFGALIAGEAKKAGYLKVGKPSAKEYMSLQYSRELPWHGSMNNTYIRMKDTGSLGDNESGVIGAYLLKWLRSRQADIVSQADGAGKKNNSEAIMLYAPRADMPPLERELYGLLVEAAGNDCVLQSNEFEKWSRKNYSKVQKWLNRCESEAHQEMRGMGALETRPVKTFFGMITTDGDFVTPLGEEMTRKMFGFKKYLEEFTIINERSAREVQLWDEYLVFAQIFGIAEAVAQQFSQLYPSYFVQQQATGAGGGMSAYDMILLVRISNSFAHAGYSGYSEGHTASYGGGGGGFSGGGGFGGSGGGSFGGGGSR